MYNTRSKGKPVPVSYILNPLMISPLPLPTWMLHKFCSQHFRCSLLFLCFLIPSLLRAKWRLNQLKTLFLLRFLVTRCLSNKWVFVIFSADRDILVWLWQIQPEDTGNKNETEQHPITIEGRLKLFSLMCYYIKQHCWVWSCSTNILFFVIAKLKYERVDILGVSEPRDSIEPVVPKHIPEMEPVLRSNIELIPVPQIEATIEPVIPQQNSVVCHEIHFDKLGTIAVEGGKL